MHDRTTNYRTERWLYHSLQNITFDLLELGNRYVSYHNILYTCSQSFGLLCFFFYVGTSIQITVSHYSLDRQSNPGKCVLAGLSNVQHSLNFSIHFIQFRFTGSHKSILASKGYKTETSSKWDTGQSNSTNIHNIEHFGIPPIYVTVWENKCSVKTHVDKRKMRKLQAVSTSTREKNTVPSIERHYYNTLCFVILKRQTGQSSDKQIFTHQSAVIKRSVIFPGGTQLFALIHGMPYGFFLVFIL